MAAKRNRKAKSRKKTRTRRKAPADPVAALDALLSDLRDLVRQPRKTFERRAIHDAWRIIFRRSGRGSKMVRRLRDFTRDKRWVYDDSSDRLMHLRPSAWDGIARNVAAPLYVELVGAYRQYLSLRVTWTTKLTFGAKKATNAQVGTAKAIAAQKKAAAAAAAKARKAAMKRYEEILKDIHADWTEKRDGLQAQFKGLQKVVVGLCKVEEDRQRARAKRLVDAREKARAQVTLRTMASYRREATRAHWEDGAQPGSFPERLRKWNGQRNRMRRMLDG